MNVRAYNDHNVYILGAGFGAEAGLPLIKDFMNRMRDAAAWLQSQAEREQEAIRRVLEFRLRAAGAAHRVPLNVENIEELFSLASATGNEELAAAMPLAITATLDYARQTAKPPEDSQRFQVGVVNLRDWTRPPTWNEPPPYVQEGMKRGDLKGSWYSCPPYDFYVGVMAGYFNKGGPERRDTIITLNYDLVIEDSLRSLGIPWSYGFGDPGEKLQVLKLHGSVNWVSLQERLSSVTDDKLRPDLHGWEGMEHLGAHVCKDYAEACRQGYRPVLLPPTWRKDTSPDAYTRYGFSRVWTAAAEALRKATNVIILGYSVPNTDQHFRYLLAAGLQDNISLRKVFFVNPALGDETQGAVLKERLFGASGLFRPELKEQGIIELLPVDTREFFTGPHDTYAGEPYRVRFGRPLNPRSCTAEDARFWFWDRPNAPHWQ